MEIFLITGGVLLYLFLGGLCGALSYKWLDDHTRSAEDVAPFFIAILWPLALPVIVGLWVGSKLRP